MTKTNKLLIFEIVMGLILIGLITSVFFVDLDLGLFKVVSQKTLMSQYDSIKDLDDKLVTTKGNYDSSLKSVETSKAEFKKQKDQYDAITQDTINIIKEATTDEKYNVEYMWIKLGNYAKSNNLVLTLVEPGGTAQADTSSTTTTQTSSTTTPTTGSTAGSTTPTTTSSTGEFSISVKGNYINVSDFIFDLENDTELRFKLDKIKMEYAGNNQITASFVVKNLKFVK